MKFLRILCIFLMGLSILGIPTLTEAHIGGGPPILKINGKFAQTNPYYQGETIINVAQDVPPASYLVGKPITFEIDQAALMKQTTISPEFAKNLTYRWSIAQGEKFENQNKNYQTGSKIIHTFPKYGSYLVITEAKSPQDPDYILIDTVQINILPSSNYKLPTSVIHTGSQNNDASKPVLLLSQTTFDPSAKPQKYLWDFNDGKVYEGKSVTRSFGSVNSYGIATIYNRVIDDHGLSIDIGFNAENVKNTLRFAPFGNMQNIPVKFESYDTVASLSENSDNNNQLFLYIGIGIAAFLIFAFAVWFALRRK